jgi:hypothetical protein
MRTKFFLFIYPFGKMYETAFSSVVLYFYWSMLHLVIIVILILFGVYNLFTEGFGETIGDEIDIFVTQSIG